MTPLPTLRPNCLQEIATTTDATFTQVFVVLYITLTDLVDSMVPKSGPWSLLGSSLFYVIKLAPILWWELLSGLAAPPPMFNSVPTNNWYPETRLKKDTKGSSVDYCQLF
ncbi:hypothetical protein DSO57_1007913 [Entomophthora muscae]|uniref:Uncharacterized protein n=1 Tax=Entomophthora muscae TaxID=34485 RepID=A0ACC2T7D4_9FUNG|nr:hypothetical protein DSO57_1007913 [Entomophthora muscae]